MFGKLLSSVIKVATLPVDAVNSAVDIAGGGSGSKSSREQIPLLGDIEKIRDRIADAAKDCDE